MTKSLMISIQPQHAVNILMRKKTLELRTWIPKDYVGWVYVYVTKGVGKSKYHHLYNLTEYNNGKTLFSITHHNKHSLVPDGYLNGKVAFRFWFDEYEELDYQQTVISSQKASYMSIKVLSNRKFMLDSIMLDNLCLNIEHINEYGKHDDLYAWHIKKLEIFDEPKELSDFYKGNRYPNGEIITPNICEFSPFDYDNDLETCLDLFRLKKPPQRSVWVYTKELDK